VTVVDTYNNVLTDLRIRGTVAEWQQLPTPTYETLGLRPSYEDIYTSVRKMPS